MVTLSVSQAAAGNYAAATASTTFAVQDFQLSAPSLITLPAGSRSSANVVISGQEGFTGTVGVTCSMPASMTAATCSATNVQLSPSASQSTATMTIATVKVFSQASNEDLLSSHKHALLLALLAPLAFLRRKSKLVRLAVLVLGLGLAGSAIGCGSGIVSGSSTGTFNVTVSAVSGTAKHTAIVPVVVQ